MWPKAKFDKKSQILFCKILKNKYHHVDVQVERFHLNGHIIGFHGPQTQKLELRVQNSVIYSGTERVNR